MWNLWISRSPDSQDFIQPNKLEKFGKKLENFFWKNRKKKPRKKSRFFFSILGQLKTWINKALPFEPCQNKIAVVEKENKTDYVAIQYLIENDWNLEVTKCLDPEKAQKTWQLKRRMDDGELCNLPGIQKVYQDKFSNRPKKSFE